MGERISMDYNQFTVEDFVLDADFRRWVLSPTAESNTFWQDWLKNNPDKITVLREARTLVLGTPSVDYGWTDDVESSLWRRILAETMKDDRVASDEEADKQRRVIPLNSDAVLGPLSDHQTRSAWYHTTAWRVAASVLLMLAAGTFGYLQFFNLSLDESKTKFLVSDAPAGTKLTLTLGDGTKVSLNSGSRIIYPDYFPAHERRVEIEGEAFLEVSKDAARPFSVKTGRVITEALGTAFNVRNESSGIEIALVEGAVRVSSFEGDGDSNSVILKPGDRASLSENGTLITSSFDVDEVVAWTQSVLLFKGASEEEVIHELEKWYGVKIISEGVSSKTWHYSGKFQNKTLDFVLMSIGYTMEFTYEIKDKTVVIRFQ